MKLYEFIGLRRKKFNLAKQELAEQVKRLFTDVPYKQWRSPVYLQVYCRRPVLHTVGVCDLLLGGDKRY